MAEISSILENLTVERLPLNPFARPNAVMDRLDAVGSETGIAVDVVGILDLFRERTLRLAQDAVLEANEQGANLVVILPKGKYRISNIERTGE